MSDSDERAVCGFVAIVALWAIVIICGLSATGCSSVLERLPAGSNVQVSTTGVRLSPQAVDGPLILGQSTYSLQTPTPADSGPGLNRNQVRAGLTGIDITSTVATGPVGDELRKAGGPEALAELLEQRRDGWTASDSGPAAEAGSGAERRPLRQGGRDDRGDAEGPVE